MGGCECVRACVRACVWVRLCACSLSLEAFGRSATKRQMIMLCGPMLYLHMYIVRM